MFLCVPAENGALTWNRFFRELHNYDLKVKGNSNLSEFVYIPLWLIIFVLQIVAEARSITMSIFIY